MKLDILCRSSLNFSDICNKERCSVFTSNKMVIHFLMDMNII